MLVSLRIDIETDDKLKTYGMTGLRKTAEAAAADIKNLLEKELTNERGCIGVHEVEVLSWENWP